jgi:hypothetical protein
VFGATVDELVIEPLVRDEPPTVVELIATHCVPFHPTMVSFDRSDEVSVAISLVAFQVSVIFTVGVPSISQYSIGLTPVTPEASEARLNGAPEGSDALPGSPAKYAAMIESDEEAIVLIPIGRYTVALPIG